MKRQSSIQVVSKKPPLSRGSTFMQEEGPTRPNIKKDAIIMQSNEAVARRQKADLE